MDMSNGSGHKHHKMAKNQKGRVGGLNLDTILIIKLPDHIVLRVLSRSQFKAIVILTLPCIGSIVRGPFSSLSDDLISVLGLIWLTSTGCLWFYTNGKKMAF